MRLVRGLATSAAGGGGRRRRRRRRRGGGGASPRLRSVGSVILVDSLHPDFQRRWRQTRQGAPRSTSASGYLATIVSSHYRERAYQVADRSRVDYAQAYEEMIGTYCRLEEGLRQVLPSLLKEMQQQELEAEARCRAAVGASTRGRVSAVKTGRRARPARRLATSSQLSPSATQTGCDAARPILWTTRGCASEERNVANAKRCAPY